MASHRSAHSLLLEATGRQVHGTRWLVIGGDAPLVQALLDDHPGTQVVWIATDLRNVAALPNDRPERLQVDVEAAYPEVGHAAHDVVVIPAPADRALCRRWLVLASRALCPDGVLLLGGANDQGIRSLIGDARTVFGPAQAEDYGGRQRIARFAKPATAPDPPPWVGAPGIAAGTWREFTASVRGKEIAFVTLPGVFAADRLDAGTRMLLDVLPDRMPGSVLDMGCGAGVIGIAASRLGARQVDLVDPNLLAVASARENVTRLRIAGARVLASDVYGAVAKDRYDLIVSNPPFHQGKEIDYTVPDRLIAEAPAHLEPGGSVLIVANAFLAYGKRMERVFRQVETVTATRQYHVLSATDPR